MRSRRALLLSLACLGLGAASLGAQAAPGPISMLTRVTGSGQLAQPVGYRSFCGRWREECREKWGFRTWRYRRCLSFHGCL